MIRFHLFLGWIVAVFLLTSCEINHVTSVHVERVLVNVTGNAVEVKP